MRCIVRLDRIKRAILAQNKPVLLMAKAQCYGLDWRVAASMDPYVCAFGVAFGCEGRVLRSLTDKPILLTTPDYVAQDVIAYRLTPAVSTVQEVRNLAALGVPIGVHLKLNSGMNRFGVDSKQALATILDEIDLSPLYVAGVMTHYASPHTYIEQNKRIAPLLSYIYARVGKVLFHSVASSCADRDLGDMVRLGMGAYQDSVTLTSRVLAIHRLRRGERAGYDGVFVAPKDCYVAVVAGGYADGLSKSMVGYRVRIDGRQLPIVAVCMDVCLVAMDQPCKDDSVCLLDETMPEPPCGLYEMYTNIGARFEREYLDRH